MLDEKLKSIEFHRTWYGAYIKTTFLATNGHRRLPLLEEREEYKNIVPHGAFQCQYTKWDRDHYGARQAHRILATITSRIMGHSQATGILCAIKLVCDHDLIMYESSMLGQFGKWLTTFPKKFNGFMYETFLNTWF